MFFYFSPLITNYWLSNGVSSVLGGIFIIRLLQNTFISNIFATVTDPLNT